MSLERQHVIGTLIAMAQRLGEEEVDAGRAMQMAREGLTFTDIGFALLPHIDGRIAQMAVARALRIVLSPSEYDALRVRNVTTGITEGGFAMFPEGTDRDVRLVQACECKSGWEDDELADLVRLTLDPANFFVVGPYKGSPSWRVIAQKLNAIYGKRRPMRNTNGCMRRYKRLMEASSNASKGVGLTAQTE